MARSSQHGQSQAASTLLAYASAPCGVRARVVRWLDVCDQTASAAAIAPGWHSFQAATLALRANFGLTDAETERAVVLTRRSVELESADGRASHPAARWGLGASLARDGQLQESASLPHRFWAEGRDDSWPPWLVLSVASTLMISLVEPGRGQDCDHVLREVASLAHAAEREAGTRHFPRCFSATPRRR